MWNEGIELAKTACALDEALESGDSGRIIELAELLSTQVKDEVSSQAELGGWYEEYDKATSHEDWDVETVVDRKDEAAGLKAEAAQARSSAAALDRNEDRSEYVREGR